MTLNALGIEPNTDTVADTVIKNVIHPIFEYNAKNNWTMRAVVFEKYGGPEVLQLRNVNVPTLKSDEVLIKIRATTVTAGDWKTRKADPFFLRFMFGLFRPKNNVLGFEFSGEIVALGEDASQFKVGDQVFGMSLVGDRYLGGTNAEYLSMPETGMLTTKPENLTHAQAAATTSATVILQGLKTAEVQPGHDVLIYGASGSLGTAAVQLAVHLGAKVTAVCGPANVDMVGSLGASEVIDYTKTDYTNNRGRYDLVFDTVGKSTFTRGRNALKKNGVYLSSWPSLRLLIQTLTTSVFGGKRAKLMTENPRLKSLVALKALIEAGGLAPVIDHHYPLERIGDAHRYVEKGHKKGNVVIDVAQ